MAPPYRHVRKRSTTRLDIIFLFFSLVITVVFVTVLVDYLDTRQDSLLKRINERSDAGIIENFGSGHSRGSSSSASSSSHLSVPFEKELDYSLGPLSRKVLEWQHSNLLDTLNNNTINDITVNTLDDERNEPHYDEFWTPISLVYKGKGNAKVTLCKLNFKEYNNAPQQYPMFKDLVRMSKCNSNGNSKYSELSKLVNEIKNNEKSYGNRRIDPNGFVFHESRVGSTLVANNLASNPWAMVFSESDPPAHALTHCDSCSKEEHVQLFRDIVFVMGKTPYHKHLFFKFQSITTTKMEIAMEAFPNTPWIFLFRQPVQTMMSHVAPNKGGSGAPCLRSMYDPPEEIKKDLKDHVSLSNPPREAWCAAHLNMLCNHALDTFNKYGKYSDGSQRGMLVDYEGLPGILPKLVFPKLFKYKVSEQLLNKMAIVSTQYSKGRGEKGTFKGDSEEKDKGANAAIQKFAEAILLPTYKTLYTLSLDTLKILDTDIYNNLPYAEEIIGSVKDFSVLKQISSSSSSQGGHPGEIWLSDIMKKEETRNLIPNGISPQIFEASKPFANAHNSKPFDAANCPLHPEKGYPKEYKMTRIVENWNTDNTEIPSQHHDSLCHFDYQNPEDYKKIFTYRDAEVPFVVYNMPQVNDIVKKWNNLDYLMKRVGPDTKYNAETSKDNHFMYWSGNGRGLFRNWKPPTGSVATTFSDWLHKAVIGQNVSLESREHQYFRVSSATDTSWLFEELPFFQPTPSIWIVKPSAQRGIHCRFGMRSVIAEAHFDGSRNAVVEIAGLRRWILTHPKECVNMHMLPKAHPSGRHSEVDWSKPDLDKFPNFAKIMGNEVILKPGDYLYVPTYWIHYIVSLTINVQCNTRSGKENNYDKYISECGF